MNSFQKWADDYARAFGFIVTPKGNWVELTKAGATIECMSVEGVQAACSPSDPSAGNWHTERYCSALDKLDRVKAIRAIQQAYLQLAALTSYADCEPYDNKPALNALLACLRDAGHPAGEDHK